MTAFQVQLGLPKKSQHPRPNLLQARGFSFLSVGYHLLTFCEVMFLRIIILLYVRNIASLFLPLKQPQKKIPHVQTRKDQLTIAFLVGV